ncbi:MAG: signal peptidase I, partial [Thermomicrobiales bacterium]
ATAAPAAEAGDAVVEAPAGPVGAAVEPAEEEQPTRGRRAMTFFREFVETILLTLVIFVAVRTLVVNFRVDGESMRPTLMNGEYLLVNRATYFHFDLNALRNILPGPDRQDRDVVYLFGPPARGDIIVFEPPFTSDKPFVKRVIGLPGDTIAIREDHRVYVNGQPLDEHYIAAPPRNLYPSDGGTYTVPPGMIFVMGDNRNNSQDSRSFSAVSMDSVIGKAVVTYWPLDVFGFVPHERYALAGDEP